MIKIQKGLLVFEELLIRSFIEGPTNSSLSLSYSDLLDRDRIIRITHPMQRKPPAM